MFRNFFKIDKSYWLVVPAVLYATVPWFYYRVRLTYVTIPLAIWVLSNFNGIMRRLSDPKYKAALAVVFSLMLLRFVNNIYALLGCGDFSTFNDVCIALNMVAFFVMAHYTITTGKWRELRFLTVVSLAGIVVAGIGGMRGLSVEGLEGARGLVSVSGRSDIGEEEMENIMLSAEYGLATYTYVYAMAWLLGPLLVAFSWAKSKMLCIIFLLASASTFIVVKSGGLGTAMIVAVLSMVLYLIWRCIKSPVVIKLSGGILLVSFFVYAAFPSAFKFFSEPLRMMSEQMDEGSIKDRIILISESFAGNEYNYAYDRAQLQLISFRTFIDNPIFGCGMFRHVTHYDARVSSEKTNAAQIGGHSTILDGLAEGGLVFLVLFWLFLHSLSRYAMVLSRIFFGRVFRAMAGICIILYVFTSVANPTFLIPEFFYYLIPGIAALSLMSREVPAKVWADDRRVGCRR